MSNWINELKKIYNKNKKKYEEIYENGKDKIEEIREDFQIKEWENISVERYKTTSMQDNNSLCYLLENKLKNSFRYMPRLVSNDMGYGYRFDAGSGKYYIGNENFGRGKGNPYVEISKEEINEKWREARNNIKEYLDSLDTAKTFEEIKMPMDGNIIDTNVFIGLGYIYYPNKIIGNIKYIDDMARKLEINIDNVKGKYGKNYKIALNFEINKKIREAEEFKNLNGYILSSAIWDIYGENVADANPINVTENTNSNENTNNIIGKNTIIYGVPGSGKSFYIKNKILIDRAGNQLDKKFYERVIFFPEYSYYDFIGQRLPNEKGELKFKKGPFTRILEKAFNYPKQQYYLIIEEMNRGNAETIFGDILQLLDRDENGESVYGIYNEIVDELEIKDDIMQEVKNKIDKKGGVYIPKNLSIYATLNNADQNVFNIDTAFGRRWEYRIQYCNPSNSEKNNENKYYYDGYIKGTNIKWNVFRNLINEAILEKKEEIYNAEDKRLGMYYIDRKCISEIESEENAHYERELFGSKVLKYLWTDVFKNCRQDIFNNSINCLEDLIQKFIYDGNLYNIFDKSLFPDII